MQNRVGIIGGSGLYALPGVEERREISVETPFGDPSSKIALGQLAGRDVAFIARHGTNHTIAPHELNHRANIWAMRSLGVRWLIAVSVVGSLRENLPPKHAVLPDQFLDRLSQRKNHTFFGNGIVAHIGFSDPTSHHLRNILARACDQTGLPCQNGGTYVCIDGPAFSTRAESNAYRQLGGDIIGMTNLPEAKLSREAEIAFATLAMVTDYDCWKTDEAPVSAEAVFQVLQRNAEIAASIVAKAIPLVPTNPDWPEHHTLDAALVTPSHLWPGPSVKNLSILLERFVTD